MSSSSNYYYFTSSSDTSMIKDIFQDYYKEYTLEKARGAKNIDEIAKKLGMKVGCRGSVEAGKIPTQEGVEEHIDESENLLYFDPKDLDI